MSKAGTAAIITTLRDAAPSESVAHHFEFLATAAYELCAFFVNHAHAGPNQFWRETSSRLMATVRRKSSC